VANKLCGRCFTARHTDRKRCDECGEVLQIVETYSLEYGVRRYYPRLDR
jgi:hypothetical protein